MSRRNFLKASALIGDRIETKFKGDVEVRYVYNILDLGLIDLPFIFPDNRTARAAMDGSIVTAYRNSICTVNRLSSTDE